MKRKKHLLKLVIVVLVILITYSIAVAERFQSTYSISIEEKYDDNIFLTEDNKIDDFITTITPAISLKWDIRENSIFELDYEGDFIHYDHTKGDEITHSLDTLISIASPRLFSIDLKDSYSFVPLDTKEPEVFENLTGENVFIISPNFKFDFTDLTSASLNYQLEMIDYEKSEGNDSVENKSSILLEHNFSRRIKNSLKYVFSTKEFKDDYDDYIAQQVFANFNGQLSSSINGQFGYGYEWRNYQDEKYLNDSMWDVQLGYYYQESDSFILGYEQSLVDDIEGDVKKSQVASITGLNNFFNRVSIDYQGFYQIDTYREEDLEDTFWGGQGEINWAINKRVSTFIGGKYENSEYPSEDQEDNLSSGSGGFLFEVLRWLTFRVEYSYTENDSNVSDNSYTDNKYSLSLKGDW